MHLTENVGVYMNIYVTVCICGSIGVCVLMCICIGMHVCMCGSECMTPVVC